MADEEYEKIISRIQTFELDDDFGVNACVNWYMTSKTIEEYTAARSELANIPDEEFEQLVARYKMEKDL